MAKINVNDSQYDGSGGNVFPQSGPHAAFVSEMEQKLSQAGNQMLVLTWTLHHPNDADCGKHVLYDYYTLTEKAIWRFVAMARAIDPMMQIDPSDKADLDRLIFGKPIVITLDVYEDTYGGKTKTKVDVKDWRALEATEKRALKNAYGPGLVPDNGEVLESTGASNVVNDDIPF